MALEDVPPYLRETLRRTHPEILQRFVDTGGGISPEDANEIAHLLGQWIEDEDYWTALRESPRGDVPQDQDVDKLLDDELRVLTDALGGDEDLARVVLLELPSQVRARGRDPAEARQVIIVIRQEVTNIQVVPDAPPPRRIRVARVLRRVFKAAVGGASIAADIVVPDPTMIIRVVSIAAGFDLIVDAAAPGLLG